MSGTVEDVTKMTTEDEDGEDVRLTIEKLKKVIQIFQTKLNIQTKKIAEVTKQSELKDKIIASAKENLEKIQCERNERENEMEKLRKKKCVNSLDSFRDCIPESVLERLQVGNNVWCFVKFPKDDQDDIDSDREENYNKHCIWITQEELIDHVNSFNCTLDLPPFSLSSSQAADLRSELVTLQQNYCSLEEEYKKYREDTETVIWDKSSEIESLKLTSTEISIDLRQESRSDEDIETMRIQRQSMKDLNLQLSRQIDNLQLDQEDMRLRVSDSERRISVLKNECDEWRRKYKEQTAKQSTTVVSTDILPKNEKETIESMKLEIEYLKSKNEQMIHMSQNSVKREAANSFYSHYNVENRSYTPSPIESGSSDNDSQTKNKYMRSLFFNYLCARDKNSRNHIQTALMTIFNFSPEEVIEIRKRVQTQWY